MKTVNIILAYIVCALCSAVHAEQTIENGDILVSFDSQGNLTSLKNKSTGEDYAGRQGLWRIIYQKGELLEEPVESEDVPVKVEKLSDSQIRLTYGGEFPVEALCWLDGECARFSARVSNNSKDKILREFQFPMIKNANIPTDASYVKSSGGGEFVPNFHKYVKSAQTQYKSQDNKAVERYAPYPIERTMNMFVVQTRKGALYFASLDPEFELTLHLARYRKENDKFKYLDVAMVKYPFAKPGESYSTAPFAVAPIRGDWRAAARIYAHGAKEWFSSPSVPEHIKGMKGWQRMILRHQYGRILFPYPELDSKINKAGLECGIDTILLFGWWKEGMDAGYPNYSPENSQGGDEALKQNIKKVQAKGGKVLLYFNGQLIDASTDFYKSGLGQKICVKTPSGMPHIERYPFGGDGTGLRILGHKTFTTACHATKEWENVLKGYVDRAVSLGVDDIFFDQLGSGSKICWDPSHGHKVPCTNMMKYKSEMLRKIRAYIKSKNPQMSFGTEYVGDATSMHADFIHACGLDFYDIGGHLKNGKPFIKFVPLFKYAFPETKVSDRTIRDDNDAARKLNLCIMWGLLSDIEIYRCRATIDSAPGYKEYMALANKLRDKYRPLILDGMYRDRDLAELENGNLDYTTFENDAEIGVFVTNSWKSDMQKSSVKVPGCEFVSADGIGAFKAFGNGDAAEVSIPRNALALLIFKKKK